MAQIETDNEVRQGPKGKPVLYVLVGGLLLAAVAGVGALTWQGTTSPPDRSSQSTEAARQTTTSPSTSPSGPQQEPKPQ